MDDGGHRENGRHKADQYKTAQSQWLTQHQPSMKQVMAIIAERDAAIQERNLAISEKKAAVAERDMAFLQRDTAIAERNNAVMERDNALVALQYRESSMVTTATMSSCTAGCQISHGVKHMHHPQQHHHMHHHHHHMTQMGENAYGSRELEPNDALPTSPTGGTMESAKPKRGKRPKEPKTTTSAIKKGSKNQRKIKKESEELDLDKIMILKTQHYQNNDEEEAGKHIGLGSKSDWKGQEMGLNQVVYDETTMPPPVCSCTGVLRQCYKWGNGGWQSSCCTTTLSMHPLPALPNKRHARVGGRKMSGSVFNKLLSRLAAEGHDLSNPVDLKDHWAKHGTNRYITIK